RYARCAERSAAGTCGRPDPAAAAVGPVERCQGPRRRIARPFTGTLGPCSRPVGPPLERFQAKWTPVRVKKTRQIKNLEPRFDSIETEKALGVCLAPTSALTTPAGLTPT